MQNNNCGILTSTTYRKPSVFLFLSFVTTVVCICFLAGCASAVSPYTTKILHQNVRFTPEEFSNTSLLIFPLIRKDQFDSSWTISAREIAIWLREQRRDFELYFKDEFEKPVLQANPQALDNFYVALFSRDMVRLQSDTVVWRAMPSTFALTIFIKESGRVKDFHRVVKRTIWMEAEVWAVKTAEVVWRAEVKGFEDNAKTTDYEFIRDGVRKVIELLPSYYPALHEDKW